MKAKGFKETLAESIIEMEAEKNTMRGVPTGFAELDELTGGLQPGGLYILAARPSMGKSALGLAIIRNAAVDYSRPVFYISLQQTNRELSNRLCAAEAEIELKKVSQSKLADYEWEQLVHKTARLEQAPILFHNPASLNLAELRESCMESMDKGTRLIVVDDIQSLSINKEDRERLRSREQEVSLIARELKSLAKELNVAILGISRLNRQVESRHGEKRPELMDLRDSGAIEDEADLVMFLYRPEYYGIFETEEGMPADRIAELIIAKHRNGSLDTVVISYHKRYCKFTDDSPYRQDNPFNSLTPKLGSKLKNGNDGSGFGYTSFPEDDNSPF